MSRTREYQVTARTFFQYSRQRRLYEAYWRDDDRVRHPINEYCETKTKSGKGLRHQAPQESAPNWGAVDLGSQRNDFDKNSGTGLEVRNLLQMQNV